MENVWYVAAIWMGLAFLASLISIRAGISVALIEILVGVVAGNIHFGNGLADSANNRLDKFSRDAWQRRADVSGGGGN